MKLVLSCIFSLFLFKTLVLFAASPKEDVPDFRNIPHFNHLPLVRQSTEYTCGVAGVQSILGFFEEDLSEEQVAKDLKADPEQGTLSRDIIVYLEKKGFQVTAKERMTFEDLEQAIRRKEPVLVLLQAWDPTRAKTDWENSWDLGHWSIVVGYDQERFYFMDPAIIGQYGFIPRQEFLARWHDTEDENRKLYQFGLTVAHKTTAPGFNLFKILPVN